MKHMVIGVTNLNELVMFSNSSLYNFSFDTFLGELEVEISPFIDSDMQSELFHTT
jgi:hypothetical protein